MAGASPEREVRPEVVDDVRRARLRDDRGLDVEPRALAMHRGREDVVAPNGAHREDAPLLVLESVRNEPVELAHLVAAVDAVRQVVALHPEAERVEASTGVGYARMKATRNLPETCSAG